MTKKVIGHFCFILILMVFPFINIASAATHLDDNFQTYANNTELHNKWTIVHWFGQKNPNANFSTGLGQTAGVADGKAMQMKFTFNAGLDPITGLGVNWEPCLFGITGYPVDVANQDDLTNYSGVSLWIKPGTLLGDAIYFKLNILEDSSIGREKWMSPKVALDTLDSNGQYIYFDFSDFWEYYTGSGQAMDRTLIERSYLFLAYDNISTQYSEATVWVDDITYVESVSYVRSPYLQNVTQTDVKIMWGDNNINSQPVFWGSSPGSYTNRTLSVVTAEPSPATGQIHTATISGLTAGEKVYYSVGSTGWNDATYYAVAAPVDNADFRFTFYSDSHGGVQYSTTNHSNIINTMIPHNPDIILHGGDHVDDAQMWEFNDYFFSFAAPILKNTPIFNTIGNHDMPYFSTVSNYTADIQNYRALFDQPTNSIDNTEDFYSFDYGNVHFVCINSQRTQSGGVHSSYYDETYNNNMRAWLDSDLQGTDKPWKVVFFHKPFYMSWQEDEEWGSIFKANGVALVLQGHRHNYIAHEYDGVTYVMAGGGGGGIGGVIWSEWAGYSIGAFQDYNFVQVDVTSSMLNVKAFDDNNVLRHWIDIDNTGNVTYPPIELVDDFEDYSNNVDLQSAWDVGVVSGMDNVQISLKTDDGITGNSNVIQITSGFSQNSTNGYGYTSTYGFWNLSAYKAIKLWVKASTTGYSNQYFQVRAWEGSGGERWESSKISLTSLDSNGEYVYLYFNDFLEYGDGGGSLLDNKFNTATLVRFIIIPGFTGTATSDGMSTILVNNINAVVNDTTTDTTHIDDNFERYADNTELTGETGKWNRVFNSSGVTSFTINLDGTGGVNSSNAMRMYIDIATNTLPVTGLGDNWDPCIYGITGYDTPASNRTNLSNYSGLRLWLKPGSVSGDAGVYFKLNLIEDEDSEFPGQQEKWMSPKVYLSSLDLAGEYVYFDFNDFTEYYTNSGAPMERRKIITSFLFLAYDNTTTQRTTATIYVDSIKYLVDLPPAPTDTTQLDDDFDKYANTTELLNSWGGGFTSNSGATITTTLSNIDGVDNSNAIQLDFTFDQGVPPRTGLGANWEPCIWGITGKKIIAAEKRTDMTDYTGIRLWLKPGTIIGDSAYFKLNLNEDQYNNVSGGAEKWMSPKVYFKDLDPNGEYVYFDFKDFYEYFTGDTSQEMDRTSIWKSYLWLAYDDTASQNSSATIWVDDIRLVRRAYKIVDVDQMAALPEKYSLYQNYPNPFNPVTTILYDIPDAGNVQLIIYDLLGREVRRLVNDRLEAGYHKVQWNGRNQFGEKVSSGVYIYLLKAGDFVQSKKLLLLK